MNKNYPIFLDNEFTDEYLSICKEALARDEPKYFEEHQIIPMDFWRFVPGYVKGRAQEAVQNKEYCNLTPEEHWRCHELLKDMFEWGTKQWCIANSGFIRIKESIADAVDAQDYGAKKKARNEGKIFTDEYEKYHPEFFNKGGKL